MCFLISNVTESPEVLKFDYFCCCLEVLKLPVHVYQKKFWAKQHRLTFHIGNLLTFQAETTVINQCNQLLSPSAEPNYVMTYLSHSFPQHRQYLCAGAWMLMNGHNEINSANLVRIFPLLLNHTFYMTVILFPYIF